MENLLHISVSPHIHGKKTTRSFMLDVVIALLPATIAGCVIFGLRALLVVAVAIASCVASEFIFNLILKRKQTVDDFSAIVTGLLLALNLPANIPIWQVVVASVFAIIVVKCVFGGLGCNIVNPAITARVFMLVAFGSMTTQAFPKNLDSVSGATPLADLANGTTPNLMDLFLGNVGGAIGETCSLALLIGAVYLLIKKVISWHIPISYIATVFVISLIVEGFDFTKALAWVLSGGLIIGAFFMATDYVTSPTTPKGSIIYGVGAGIITILIRFWGNYPEGVSFAILIMNILNPYIDALTGRKVFGGDKK